MIAGRASIGHALFGLTLACLLAGPTVAAADERASALLAGLESLSASFVQEVWDESGRVVERSDGQFAMQAPDRFRWHYETPYEQLIVADGERVWMHDVDLEQVTVRDQGEAAGSSPLYVLTRPETLSDRYAVSWPEAVEGEAVMVLRPLAAGADFDRVILRFVDEVLQDLVIDDAFGQQTAIRFEGVERNPELESEAFRFTPPEGVDVLGLDDLLGEPVSATGIAGEVGRVASVP